MGAEISAPSKKKLTMTERIVVNSTRIIISFRRWFTILMGSTSNGCKSQKCEKKKFHKVSCGIIPQLYYLINVDFWAASKTACLAFLYPSSSVGDYT